MSMNRHQKTTLDQYEMLVSFMEDNPDLCRHKTSPIFTKKDQANCWEEITTILNNVEKGFRNKDSKTWRKTWADYKYLIRSKSARIKARSKNLTEGESGIVEVLTPLERRVLRLIGEDNRNESDYSILEDNTHNSPADDTHNSPADDTNNSNADDTNNSNTDDTNNLTVKTGVAPSSYEKYSGEQYYLLQPVSEGNESILVPIGEISQTPHDEAAGSSSKKRRREDEGSSKTQTAKVEPIEPLKMVQDALTEQSRTWAEVSSTITELVDVQKSIAQAEQAKAAALQQIADAFTNFCENFKK